MWCVMALISIAACAVRPSSGAATVASPIAADTAMRFVSMDSAEYRFSATSRQLKLFAVFRNTSRDTLYLGWCGGELEVAIERLTNGGWKRVDWRDCILFLREAVVVAPGQS